MVIQNSHLRFLPRSVQLSMPPPPPLDTDKKKKRKKKHRKSIEHLDPEESNPSPTEEFELQVQRKRKAKNADLVIEEDSRKANPSAPATRVDGDSNGLKKNKKKRGDLNKHSAEDAELKQLIAEFLSSRGLTNTLSVFLSETQHEYAGKTQNLDLEEIYSYHLNQGGAKFKKQEAEEVKLTEQAGDAVLKDSGKLNKGVKWKGKDIKRRDGKEKYADDADAAPPSTGGGALEQGLYKNDKNHDSAKESMDGLDSHGHSKKIAKGKKNSAVLISTNEGRNEPPKATDDLGVVSELSEPVLKLQKMPTKEKKKKKMADESILSDNNKQTDGKESKKEKKAYAAKLFSTVSHGINADAINGSMLDLLEDSRNELDITKSSLDETIPRDHEGLSGSKKSKKEKKQFEEKLHSTSSHPVNGEAAKGSGEYLSEDPKNSLDIQVSKKKRRSDGMISGDAEEHIGCKKSKKEKKALAEKLLSTDLRASYPINGEVAKGSREYLSEDPGNTLDIGVPKKKKRCDKMIPRDAEEQISGKKSKKGKKALAEKLLLTDTHAINGQAAKGTIEDLSEDPGNSLYINVSKKKKSDEMVARDNQDLIDGNKSKKGKKGFEEKLWSSSSHAINGETVKGSMGVLAEDTNNMLDITWDHRTSEAKEFAKGAEVRSKEDCAVVNGYQKAGVPGKLHNGKEEIKGHMAAKSRKSEQQKSDVPTAAKAFQRVMAEEVKFADPRLQDNSYWAKDGAENGYGAKAQEVLGQVRGKNFRHEKTKKKKGTYTGGMIDVQPHSIKFSYSDEEGCGRD